MNAATRPPTPKTTPTPGTGAAIPPAAKPRVEPRHGFEPTFPLDASDLESRIAISKALHPRTWMVPALIWWAATMSAPAVPVVPAMLVGAALTVLWLRRTWTRLEEPVRAKVERDLIDESNRRQNERLSEIIRIFRNRGLGHYAAVVSRFLREKRRCEAGIGRDGTHYSTVEKMENLVDGLCSGACRELDLVARLDRNLGDILVSRDELRLKDFEKRRKRHLESIFDAYAVLADSAETLTIAEGRPIVTRSDEADLLDHRPRESGADDFHRSIDELRTETTIARRVKDRLAEVATEPADLRAEPAHREAASA